MAAPPQQRPNPAALAERDAKIYRLKIAGMTERAIAAEVGLSPTRVHEIIADEVAAHIGPVAEEYADHREAELEALHRVAWREIYTAKSTADRLKAIETDRRINESRRKLRGADAPVKSELEITAQLDENASGMLAVIVASVTAAARALEGDRSMPVHLIEQYGMQYAQYEMARLAGDDVGMPPEPPRRVVSGRVLLPGTDAHHEADSAAQADVAVPMPAPSADTDDEDPALIIHELDLIEAEFGDLLEEVDDDDEDGPEDDRSEGDQAAAS
ncbi:hypothetical protein ABZ357_21400 [Streptomyces sp. NPDC005917]|uniref:hypothetical protein n=1 Tax=unclassified Streptomyces TaxID=2593676 RepID=UPI0033DDC498